MDTIKNTLVLISICFFFSLSSYCQVDNSTYVYYVQFKSKQNTVDIVKATDFLSKKSLQRRDKSNVEITLNDLPISASRIGAIRAIKNINFHYALKWSNGVVVSSTTKNCEDFFDALEFVASFQLIKKPVSERAFKSTFESTIISNYNYGQAKSQIELISLPYLHQFGFKGNGVSIALFDNGYKGIDTLPLFENLWKQHKVFGQYNIVKNSKNVIQDGGHGTAVLSTISALSQYTMVGSAPNANFYLFTTEDNRSESLLEEYNWARAAEIADSLGVDIINSSLGYSTFDDTTTSHSYNDLDGNTTVVTRAANTAFSKGILVVNSAGNYGNNEWRYIIAPADGKDVLSIGATDSLGEITDFSSRGPNASGMLKPNVCAMGALVTVASDVDGVKKSNGTSFSAPTIAGAASCLFEAFPKATNKDIFKAIEESSNKFYVPNNAYGFGIPNFKAAYTLLSEKFETDGLYNQLITDYIIYPNPASSFLYIKLIEKKESSIELYVYNYLGIKLSEKNFGFRIGEIIIEYNTKNLAAGYYIIELKRNGESQKKVFIKN